MKYKFRCAKCHKSEEREILMKDYDREKENQKCTCGGKMDRVIEWEGIATGEGQGWFGKSDGSNAI
jgi:hypothetical protein